MNELLLRPGRVREVLDSAGDRDVRHGDDDSTVGAGVSITGVKLGEAAEALGVGLGGFDPCIGGWHGETVSQQSFGVEVGA